MGAATQVHPLTLLVDRNLFSLWKVFNNLNFEVLSHVTKKINRLIPGVHDSFHGKVGTRELLHALFNALEVFRGEIVACGKVVIEAIFNRGANRDLSPGKQLLYGLRQ